jgi:hypothetical protein
MESLVLWSWIIIQASGLRALYVGPSSAEQFETDVSAQVSRVFNNAANADRGSVDVMAASPGAWNKSLSCQTPKLWIYVYGMYRTHDVVRGTLRQMANYSSNDCYFVSAVVLHEGGIYTKMIEEQAFFGGRMAFTIVSPRGMYERFPEIAGDNWVPPSAESQRGGVLSLSERVYALQPALDVYWYLLHKNIELAAPIVGLTPQPSSVLIRTRFDIRWNKFYTLGNLMKTFESSPRGLHLAFGNLAGLHLAKEGGGEGDYSFISSYSGYGTDIANAYEYDAQTKTGPFPSTARTNGWGFGYSMCGFRTHGSCSKELDGAFVDIGNSQYCMDKASGQLERQCCAGGRACAMTMVHSKHLTKYLDIFRDPPTLNNIKDMTEILPLAGPFDLTKNVRLYCPSRQDAEDDEFQLQFGGQTYLSRNEHDLIDNKGRVMNPWGVGC